MQSLSRFQFTLRDLIFAGVTTAMVVSLSIQIKRYNDCLDELQEIRRETIALMHWPNIVNETQIRVWRLEQKAGINSTSPVDQNIFNEHNDPTICQ